MKRFALLFLLLAGCEVFIHSQSLVFIRDGVVLENNSTYIAREVDKDLIINPRITVKNVSEGTIEATFTVTLLEELIGDEDTFIGFCGWGVDVTCVPVFYESPKTRTTTIVSGNIQDPDVEAFNVVNEKTFAKVEYKLTYGGTEQKLYVTFTTKNTEIVHLPKKNDIIFSYEGESVFMKYNFDTTANRHLNLYSITGVKIAEIELFKDTDTIQLPSIQKGVYVYSITENNKTFKSGKYIVR
jgi:hypothetical protein